MDGVEGRASDDRATGDGAAGDRATGDGAAGDRATGDVATEADGTAPVDEAAGVDEAGKGPVVGSMFAAAVRAPPGALPDGIADSKRLSPERRETFAARIRDVARVGIAEVPVDRIDDPERDMNELTVAAQAKALDAVATDGLTVTVDAGDVDAARFGRRVAGRVDATIDVDARHRADETDDLVAAASVVAKVARDAHVAALAERHGDLGSGYPSDETTRAFLRDRLAADGEFPPCTRTSWSTCADIRAAVEQRGLADF